MDYQTLWEAACRYLREEMNEILYNTWITGGLDPIRLEGDTMVVCAKAGYMKLMISRYAATIGDCLTRAAGRPIGLRILAPEELNAAPGADTPGKAERPEEVFRENYTFESFVVGSNNRFAHAASLAVAEQPATAYNPLYIYGSSGLGKTHLMHAIGHYIRRNKPELRILYLTAEEFTNELIQAIQQSRNIEFRNRYRNVDVLMIDDIQFIANRAATQEEFFNTFNALHSAGKQVILTSDRMPKEITGLEERLITRFSWGLTADITRPDFDTRLAILQKKAGRDLLAVDKGVLELIATHVDSNIRDLEGTLNKLVAYSRMVGQPITVPLCEEALHDILHSATRPVNAETVIRVVAGFYSLSPADLTGKSRRRDITLPRQIAVYLCRELADMSSTQIGAAFGGRDHTTIMYSYDQVKDRIGASADTAATVEDLRRMVLESK